MEEFNYKQRGAALVVSMVMLMVLTVLAVSTMRTAGLELLMAGNEQYAQNAFQLAETGIERHMAETIDNLDTGKCTGTNDVGAAACDKTDINVGDMGSYTTRGVWRRESSCTNMSSEGVYIAFNYEVVATGDTGNTNANSTNTAGWYLCVPQPN